MEEENRKILIDNLSSLADIQNAFTLRYPFLKIEFVDSYKSAKAVRTPRIDPSSFARSASNVAFPFTLDINSSRTVSEVSTDVKNALGIAVQVFRKTGNVWNEISVTDGWTLASQNAAGESISSEMQSNLLSH